MLIVDLGIVIVNVFDTAQAFLFLTRILPINSLDGKNENFIEDHLLCKKSGNTPGLEKLCSIFLNK